MLPDYLSQNFPALFQQNQDPMMSMPGLYDDPMTPIVAPGGFTPAPQVEPAALFSNPSAAPTIYPTVVNPMTDYSSMFSDLIKKSSSHIDGITAQSDKLRNELNDMDTWAERNKGGIGVSLLGALVGLAAGGDASQVLGGAAAVGKNYYNNLEAQEKEKKLRMAQQLTELEKQRTDMTNFGQQLEIGQLNAQVQDARDLAQGRVVGSPQWNQEQTSKITQAGAMAQARSQFGSASTKILTPEAKVAWSKQLGVEPAMLNTTDDVDNFLRLKGQKDTQGRFTGRMAFEQEKLKIPGLADVVDPQTQAPMPRTTLEHKQANTLIQAYDQAVGSVDLMQDLYKKNKGVPVTGDDAAQFEAASATLYKAIRMYQGTGANLTQNEQPLVEALNVPNLSRNGIMEVFENFIRKGPVDQQLNAIQNVIHKVIGASLYDNKYQLPGFEYDPNSRFQWKDSVQGLSPEQQRRREELRVSRDKKDRLSKRG